MTAKLGFSIKSLDLYEWPVDVKVPVINADGDGDYEIHRFIGRFRHLSLSEANALAEKLKTALAAEKEAAGNAEVNVMEMSSRAVRYQVDLYMDIWQGWGADLTDEHGEPLPYTPEMKRKLLEERMIRDAVIEAHKQSQGGEKVRLGNSATSPAAGAVAGAS